KGRVTVDIPTTALAADQYPLSVSLDVSPEYATADVTYIPSWSSYAAKLAWNGSEYLIVWEEDRAADPNDVFATRVTPTGEVLDPEGLPLATTPAVPWRPAVAWSGSEFLVAWEDSRDLAASGPNIYASRVTSDGQALDPGGIPISTAQGEQGASAVTSNGDT